MKADVSLIHEYLGENVHHINLARLKGNDPGKFDIDSIIHEVMIELGLSSMLDMSTKEPGGS